MRAIKVFRDQTNLSTSPGLWDSVQRELAASEFLILLASPDAARPKWVRKFWLAHASSNNLLIVLTDGTIAYDGDDQSRTRHPVGTGSCQSITDR